MNTEPTNDAAPAVWGFLKNGDNVLIRLGPGAVAAPYPHPLPKETLP